MKRLEQVQLCNTNNSNSPIFAHHRIHESNISQKNFVTHPFASIALLLQGFSQVEHQSKWNFEPGCVILVPAGHPHRVIESSAIEYLGVGFSTCNLYAKSLTKVLTNVRFGASPIVKIPTHRLNFIQTLFSELITTSNIHSQNNFSVQSSLLTLILSEITNSSDQTHFTHRNEIASNALQYIEQHCLKPIRLDEVAKAIKRSPEYISTHLSQTTGQSFSKWVTTYRMNEARRLLLYSADSIEIIAEKIGYGDTTHFVRTFKREHNTTPAVWRKQQTMTYKPNK